MKISLSILLASAAVAAAIAVAGCGGGGDNDGSTTASTATTGAATGSAQGSDQAQTGGSATGGSANGGPKNSFTLGSPADVPRSKGGDNSIQDYGTEAGTDERAAAGRALAAYYAAFANRDMESACAQLASATRDRVEQTLKQLTGGGGANGP